MTWKHADTRRVWEHSCYHRQHSSSFGFAATSGYRTDGDAGLMGDDSNRPGYRSFTLVGRLWDLKRRLGEAPGAPGNRFGAGSMMGASINCFMPLPSGGTGSPTLGGMPGGSGLS